VNELSLRSCEASPLGTFYDVLRPKSDHTVATVVVRPGRPQVLEVAHPSPLNRVDGVLMSEADNELLDWFSSLDAVNAALARVGASPVSSVAWLEWVRTTGTPIPKEPADKSPRRA
jgi:hypothetical protein